MNFRLLLLSFGVIIIVLFGMFSWSTYQYYTMIHADDPITPSLTVIEGGAKIIRGDIAIELSPQESYDLEEDDAIETNTDGLGQITWPDRSITRMGPSTRIIIHRMLAEVGYEKIEISFTLKKGKIWSNVIRALIGDSYFETKLPKNNIVAGVRGTVYEINLDKNYIHAINHALELNDTKTGVLLMPGEIVNSENIWLKLGREYLDTVWGDINSLSDTLYITERSRLIRDDISHNANFIIKNYDRLVRWILSHFEAFQLITLQDLIAQGDIETITSLPVETLTQYYQRIQSLDMRNRTDTLRSALYEKVEKSGSGMEYLLKTLELGSLWETLETGKILPGTAKILENTRDLGSYFTLDNIEKFIDTKSLQTEAKGLLESVLR